MEVICEKDKKLIDINKSNTVYNGKLYLIDPSNYYINDINDLLIFFKNKEINDSEKQDLIVNWNYNKINKLIYELLFMIIVILIFIC